MPKNKKHRLTLGAVAAILAAEALWGINKPVIKVGLETIPLPLYLAVTVLATALLVLPLALRDWKRLSNRDYLLLIIGSVISITVGNVVLLMGLQRVPAINASLIGLFSPLLLFVLSVEFLKEKVSFQTFAGILVAFAGGAVIVGQPWTAPGGMTSDAALGNMLLILSVLSDIVGTLVTKSVLKKGGLYQVTFIHLFSGILPIVVFSLPYLYALAPSHAGTRGYQAMGFNIIAITLANCLFMYGLKIKRAQDVGVFTYVSPIATIVSAWLILDERLTPKIVSGAALIFLGVYLTLIKSSSTPSI